MFLYLNALHASSAAGSSSALRAVSGPSAPKLSGLRTNVSCRVRVRSGEVHLPSLDAQLKFWQPQGYRSPAAFDAPGLPRRQRPVVGQLFALIERESYSAGQL
jgi:hypothetical protein